MKRLRRLGLFALLVCLFLAEGFGLIWHFGNVMTERSLNHYRELQKVQVALAIVTFHSYYHVWPVPSGPLDTNALFELDGSKEAKINTQHIDFFEKNNCDENLLDRNGRNLFFKPDDSIGTCSVYEGY